jgi:hypothetical protein
MKKNFYQKAAMVVTVALMFAYTALAQTTISVEITDPMDDAEEYASDVGGETVGQVYNNSSDLELVFDSENQYVGLIFRGVQIPVGATVTNAYVQFTVDAISAGTTDAALTLEIYGAKVTNVATGVFDEAVPFAISSQPATTATVQWSPGPSVAEGDAGANEQTADLSPIINEIIAQPGWAPGNALMIIIKWTGDQNSTENINREMESCPPDGTAAPVLWVTYSEGSAVNPIQDGMVNVYPNPTEGILNITNPARDQFSFEIYSIDGKLVARRMNVSGETAQFNMSGFVKGVYFVDVKSSEKSQTHKVILK